MLRRVALVRTDVTEKPSASIIRVTRIGELGTLAVTSNRCKLRRHNKLAVTSNWRTLRRKLSIYLVILSSVGRLLVTANVASSPILVTLMMEALSSSETSVLTGATRSNIPEDGILHSHRRENLQILHNHTWFVLQWLPIICLPLQQCNWRILLISKT
jgi:hypothetical protein